MKRLFKFVLTKPSYFWLVATTFMLLGLVRLGLWLLPFATLQKLLSHSDRIIPLLFRKRDRSVNDLIWAVNVSSKYMPGGVKCLARALTTEVLMKFNGYVPELRIGVAQSEAGKLEAHAWIESQGKVLIGQLNDLGRFRVLPLPTREVSK